MLIVAWFLELLLLHFIILVIVLMQATDQHLQLIRVGDHFAQCSLMTSMKVVVCNCIIFGSSCHAHY